MIHDTKIKVNLDNTPGYLTFEDLPMLATFRHINDDTDVTKIKVGKTSSIRLSDRAPVDTLPSAPVVSLPAEIIVGKGQEQGLEWGPEYCTKSDYQAAFSWCHYLGDNWRIPTRVELIQAYHAGVEGFTYGVYWSSDLYNSFDHWRVSFINGDSFRDRFRRGDLANTRVVRGF